jgi:hypothetical protein
MQRRTKSDEITSNQLMTLSSQLVARMNLANKLGLSYSDTRDIYQALGYPGLEELKFPQYYAQYRRQDIAKAVIKRPVEATWRGDISLVESDDDQETELEKAWDDLMKDDSLKLKNKFSRLDRLTGLGKYGILILGLSDIATTEKWAEPVMNNSNLRLMYVKPISEINATIELYETKSNDPRFGLPLYYKVSFVVPGGHVTSEVRVHYSRIIHVTDDQLESEIEGTPRLEDIFNRLKDLEKLVGGSAEMFWRGARPGYNALVDKDYTMSKTVEDDLMSQIDEYEHNLRRILKTEGVSLKGLEMQVANPKEHVDVQIQMISAVKGIPKRILTGSERGELSSSQDADEWDSYVKGRREEFAEPQIIRPFVKRLMEFGILPESSDGYSVEWEEMFSQSDKEKAEIGRVRSESLSKYAASGAESVMPFESFLEYFMGFNKDQIDIVVEMRKQAIDEEQKMQEQIDKEIQKQQSQTQQRGQEPTGRPNVNIHKMKRRT